MEENIERDVEKTISSIDDMQLIEAPPFFYTRLKARMEKGGSPVSRPLLRPLLAMAGLALFIALNLFTILRLNNRPAAPTIQTEQVSPLESFASIYGLNDQYSN